MRSPLIDLSSCTKWNPAAAVIAISSYENLLGARKHDIKVGSRPRDSVDVVKVQYAMLLHNDVTASEVLSTC